MVTPLKRNKKKRGKKWEELAGLEPSTNSDKRKDEWEKKKEWGVMNGVEKTITLARLRAGTWDLMLSVVRMIT